MKAKKLHTNECYVCIINIIRSVLTLALRPCSWLALGYEALTMALVLMVLALTSKGKGSGFI